MPGAENKPGARRDTTGRPGPESLRDGLAEAVFTSLVLLAAEGVLVAIAWLLRDARLPGVSAPYDLGWLFGLSYRLLLVWGGVTLAVLGILIAVLRGAVWLTRGRDVNRPWIRLLADHGPSVAGWLFMPIVGLGLFWAACIALLWFLMGSWDKCYTGEVDCQGGVW
ncbi:hypothetical protein ACFS5L_02045 [Streptomyces phyllanthi]|uniref:Uncharacterized protein n=1 Tax=Streptomyces phyllanthi TaxID=1803180 RepID=A0A5N8VWN1_9ACTN|nr:hypothetical protein [Streptomyces phyllanthi]MPY38474.1 hypothetical protein [Streptomyces phyllanthi]